MEDEARVASLQISQLTEMLIDEKLSQLPFQARSRFRKCFWEFASDNCSLEIINVPAGHVGLAIGKRASTIEKIRETTGCTLQVGFNDASNPDFRPAYLFGTKNSINEAANMLHETFKSQRVKIAIHGINCNYYELWMIIPNNYLRHLMGEDGTTLRYLQLKTQTNLCMREDKINGELTNKLIIFGEPSSVDRARQFIYDWLKNADKQSTKERPNKVNASESQNGNSYLQEWLSSLSDSVDSDWDDYDAACQTDIPRQNKEIDLEEKILQLEKQLEKFQIKKQTLSDDFMKVQETLKQEVDDLMKVQETLKQEADDFMKVQETLKQEKENMKLDYEEKILMLTKNHETFIQEILEAKQTPKSPDVAENRFDVEKMEILTCRFDVMVQELIHSKEKQATEFTQNGVVQNLINSYTKHIADWITIFAYEVNIPELKQNESAEIVFVSLLQKFEELGEKQKGFVVIGIALLGSVIGMTSSRFLLWAWSKLLEFASRIAKNNPIIVDVWVESFVNTTGYRKLIETWNSGQSIGKEEILSLGIDILRFAFVRFAPSLFTDDILINQN